MINAPKTKEEARRYRYGLWASDPNGTKYVEHCCAYEIASDRGMLFYQCHFRNGKGPDGLYCGIHARKVK